MRHTLMKIGVLLLLKFSASIGIAADKPSEYNLNEGGDIRSAFPFPYESIKNSNISLNKSWDELPEKEKNIVRGYYEKMPAGDEPPFPLEGLMPLYTAFSGAHRKMGIAGDLNLIARIGSDGTVQEVKNYSRLSSQAVSVYAKIVLLTKFKPAKCAGQACVMDFPLHFSFVHN
ncbi:hypothetical protein V8J88_04435 [Massilia sp. W12]|uniref:hypothetical protein n=1 Tax=Massilia sp. W12 TaxID=3126507 RepID=UPI0030CC314E